MVTNSIAEYFYPEIKAGGFSRVDGTIEFYQRVNSILKKEDVVLDIGAGRGAAHVDNPNSYRTKLMNFKGKSAKVVGLDVDPAILDNPSLEEAFVFDGTKFPMADASINLAFADWVLEHVPEAKVFASELHRILPAGGWFCARTPNKWGYISIASRMVPEWLHGKVLRRAQPERKTKDVFPTFYRLNTVSDLHVAFPSDKWDVVVYTHDSEPAYFGNSKFLWTLAKLMFRFTPSSMGSVLMIFARRK